ncbi:hypothetical protein NADFUDRAFT_42859 [Nadsonia fulvescens var. elongata DSM 6958]|uniref:t-SNARE affecting a late Golgi compartment protein 1 n=1 Tax=Nadsonia fulvescens var. elongata DSM 6958 TaxID=857566 RepID=A0A1E3PGP0_9ASCO|nr:hypothetical protein NADFUDRAFT_42859 [Nadsonia fulvescens var. elongata DSM 6958]
MDPFNQVYSDAVEQIQQLDITIAQYRNQGFASGTEHDSDNIKPADIANLMDELGLTVDDLLQSVEVARNQPEVYGLDKEQLRDRSNKVSELTKRLKHLQESTQGITMGRGVGANLAKPSGPPPFGAIADEPGVSENPYANDLLQQDIMQEQDQALDGVYQSVNVLREQANVMSRELEDQSYMLDDLDTHVDRSQDKLRRGIKRIETVYRKNEDTFKGCLLILVL